MATKKTGTKPKPKPKHEGRGRPPRAGEPMEEMLRVRFTSQEWDDLGKYADREGTSRSEVVRGLLVKAKVIRNVEA